MKDLSKSWFKLHNCTSTNYSVKTDEFNQDCLILSRSFYNQDRTRKAKPFSSYCLSKCSRQTYWKNQAEKYLRATTFRVYWFLLDSHYALNYTEDRQLSYYIFIYITLSVYLCYHINIYSVHIGKIIKSRSPHSELY